MILVKEKQQNSIQCMMKGVDRFKRA